MLGLYLKFMLIVIHSLPYLNPGVPAVAPGILMKKYSVRKLDVDRQCDLPPFTAFILAERLASSDLPPGLLHMTSSVLFCCPTTP